MTADGVLRDVEGDVTWITLNRPDRYNAFDSEMLLALAEAVRSSWESGVIVITGAGKGFCAGAYLQVLAESSEAALRRLHASSLEALSEIRRSPRPVIAAVNGPAIGGGNELVIACDLAIASERAVFGQTGPRVGSAPILGATNLLSVVIGEKRAKEVSFLCRRYTAQQALEWGWVNAVVPHDQLRAEVTRWAEELLSLSPRYLEIAKTSTNIWWDFCRYSMLVGLNSLMQAFGSYDMIEGARAFLEKRKPNFRSLRARERDKGE